MRRWKQFTVVAGATLLFTAQQRPDPLAEPFRGVTASGTVQPGLFTIRKTGVSTAPVKAAADRFIATLTEDQKKSTLFPVDDIEWRKWNNVHRYDRQGVAFANMTDAQREAAWGLLRASLSAKGFTLSRDIMRLNGYLQELLPARASEYGEGLYNLTVMGTPSVTEPWGWQLDGHHLIINYFVLGDQVVMTPTFMGSEPVSAKTSKYGNVAILEAEEAKALEFMNSLNAEQRAKAVLNSSKTANNSLAQAFRDNLVLDYAGLRGNELNIVQRENLVAVINEYVRNMDDGHARVRMSEIRAHLNDTYFAWIGDTAPNSVFYYRVHSPVLLIEFDHQTPVALPDAPRGVPTRQHVHTVVRTPNGNDYGKDLLRQHYEAHKNDAAHGHFTQRR